MFKKIGKLTAVLLLVFLVVAFTVSAASADNNVKDGGNNWHKPGWGGHDSGWFMNNGWHWNSNDNRWYSDPYYQAHKMTFDDKNRWYWQHNYHWWKGKWQDDRWTDPRDR